MGEGALLGECMTFLEGKCAPRRIDGRNDGSLTLPFWVGASVSWKKLEFLSEKRSVIIEFFWEGFQELKRLQLRIILMPKRHILGWHILFCLVNVGNPKTKNCSRLSNGF